MKKIVLLLIIVLSSCSRPLYIKDRHFDCTQTEHKMDSDLQVLIYESLKRATVTKKDIPDYRLLWKKHRIYVLNEYQTDKTDFISREDWNKSLSFLNPNDIPNKIENVSYCLKSKEELQKIADRTWEDFLHISFSLIKIEGNKATIKIDNSWVVSKHNKKTVHLSGGGYTCVYKKVNEKWEFEKITSSWIS
tara:strand:+ start:923 stop:1495 length:573 start_codon:yes stop_codon:yes gene_type:complete